MQIQVVIRTTRTAWAGLPPRRLLQVTFLTAMAPHKIVHQVKGAARRKLLLRKTSLQGSRLCRLMQGARRRTSRREVIQNGPRRKQS